VTVFQVVVGMVTHARPLRPLVPAEQTMVMPVIRQWTTAEVRALIREDRAWPRYELLDGELLVTPAPHWSHQYAALEFAVLLYAFLAQEPIGSALISPADLELKPGTVTQPDVFVVPARTTLGHEPQDWPDVRGLLLAIEILSPSSLRNDRVLKRDFYLANGVHEYWIVDVEARVLERWRPAQDTAELLCDAVEWAPSSARSSLTIDLPALFDRVEAKVRG
jgi:Uma2 family endonuclease